MFFVLCAFNRAEYKVETLKSNDGMSVMVYIPKNFCRYEELEIVNNTISKITALDYDSSLEIELQPSVDFARLEIVLVVDMQSKRE